LQKKKTYRRVRFDAKTILAADAQPEFAAPENRKYLSLNVDFGVDEWSFDTLSEFLAATAESPKFAFYLVNKDFSVQLQVDYYSKATRVCAKAPAREQIERIFSLFERDVERCRLPEILTAEQEGKIFIGHGRSTQWRDLKDHLHDQHGYDIQAYEIGSRAGHTIRDILEEMLEESTFALLVMTAEDETKDGNSRARQNVIHEIGLFQGKLGFHRAIMLLEEGTEEFSNVAGIQHINFPKGSIRAAFGDVLAVLRREVG
jgi:hypothetical protein